jgi:hypothetical protein
MKKLTTLILGMALTGFGLPLVAQQSQSDTQPGAQQQQQQPSDQTGTQQQPTSANNGQSAQSFQGKIMRSGNQLVFQDSATQTTYQVDDSSKIAPFEGKDVKLMGTLDSKTNSIHVVDVTPAEK